MAIYMKINGVDGECSKKGHEKWVELHSFQFGARKGGGGMSGSEKQAGVACFDDIHLTKNMDTSTPKVLKGMCLGTSYDDVLVDVTISAEKGEQCVMKYKLDHVVFSHCSVSCSGEGRPAESLALNYNKIKIECFPFGARNDQGGAVEFGWDINKAESA